MPVRSTPYTNCRWLRIIGCINSSPLLMTSLVRTVLWFLFWKKKDDKAVNKLDLLVWLRMVKFYNPNLNTTLQKTDWVICNLCKLVHFATRCDTSNLHLDCNNYFLIQRKGTIFYQIVWLINILQVNSRSIKYCEWNILCNEIYEFISINVFPQY